MTDFAAVLKYAITKRLAQLLVAIISFFVSIIIALSIEKEVLEHLWGLLEPAIGITTLTVAVLVWFGETDQDYENELPKRLNISFCHEEREVMICKNAYLAGEGDIRAWGQQLGGQMAGNPRLKFKSFVQEPGKRKQKGSVKIKQYNIKINLEDLPCEHEERGKVVNQEQVDMFKQGRCLTRKYDLETGAFDEDWDHIDSCQNPKNT